MNERSAQEQELFEAARKLTQPAQRAAFLDAACAGNAALRKRLDELLGAQGEADAFFRPLPSPPRAAAPPPPKASEPGPDEQIGTMIGRYKLLQKIGEGGFGVVYLAEQKEPVKRRVALKIIKLGMDTKQVVARFEAERQALALMDHPNIAKIYDGGMTGPAQSEISNLKSEIPQGRPYFVMELVRGVPITQYCDDNQLSTDERLELFLQVCHAVQHAHQKGIIHRDLKPSNILITVNDGKAVPKVIDFGVAKATQQELTDKTIVTQFHHFIGTPAYMSPEQAAMTSLDLDTRSDIYALGVLLYELLTGKTPFDGKELLASGLDEMRRTIRDKEPPRPSTRLSTMTEGDRTTAARLRKTDSPKLIHQLRGDLDWIVMKCLEKDRNRRYETANGLATDLKRHLNNEPVVARPPSTVYRLQKAIRRNRLAFAAGAIVLTSLLFALGLSTWSLQRTIASSRTQATLRVQAERAEWARTEELGKSLLAFARASRQSGEPGRRFASLEAITKAAAIHESLELRNEAIAALALTDLAQPQVWQAADFTSEWQWNHNHSFDSDLERYAVGKPDNAISICRVTDQQELLRLPPASAEGRSLLFSPDGKWLAVRYDDGWLRVWDLERRVTTVAARLYPNLRLSLDFSPDSRSVVAGSTNNVVRGFEVATGREIQPFPISLSPANLLFDPSGQVLAVHDGRRCELWHWERRVLLRTIAPPGGPPSSRAPTGSFTAWAWHPDGIRFASGTDREEIYLWDTSTGNYQVLRQPNSYVAHLFFSPRGDLLVSDGWDSTTRVWDAQTGQPMLTTESGYAWRFSRDGQKLGFFREDGRLGFWPLSWPQVFRTLNTRLPPAGEHRVVYGGSFSPDGRHLVWGQQDGVRWLDLVSGDVGFHLFAGVTALAFRPDGSSLLTKSEAGLRSWPVARETNGASQRLRLGPPAPVSTRSDQSLKSFALSQDGQTLAAGGKDYWMLRTPGGEERVMKYPTRFNSGNSFILSPDNRWVGLGFWEASAFVCDARTGEPVQEFPEVRAGIMAFTPDGRWLVTGGAREYRFWETGTWQAGRVIQRELASRASGAIAFGFAGRLMAIARTAYTVQLLDPQSGDVLADLTAPNPQPIGNLCFSPDGSILAVSGSEGLHLWDLRELRRELGALGLDWKLPPYPPGINTLGTVAFRCLPEQKE